ncbi:MAG: TIM barrel protein [Verrucomicrobiota bacterium]|nr:sugar phosphate isomerase/epimerase [Limisphaera sp.]MDW8381173.1 TIM barrel protein [Verrucomicrobiota bacterium]
MGIGDEAGVQLDSQIHALRRLGWTRIEPRTIQVGDAPKGNFHDIPDSAFDTARARLEAAGIQVHCLGSTIMNWAKTLDTPWEVTLNEVRRAIPRMKRVGARYIRIMSFRPGDDEYSIPKKVFERVRDVTRMFLDHGLQPLHENCMNYGGMSWQHALELLDKCPGLKWVFDTANPILNPDRSKPKPWPRQDPWEFWEHIRDHVEHIHIKDATWVPERNDATYHWPGEGQGRVRDILQDALARGYNGGISIEPHMVTVFHDPKAAGAQDEALQKNFVEYGQRLESLLSEIQTLLRTTASKLPT